MTPSQNRPSNLSDMRPPSRRRISAQSDVPAEERAAAHTPSAWQIPQSPAVSDYHLEKRYLSDKRETPARRTRFIFIATLLVLSLIGGALLMLQKALQT